MQMLVTILEPVQMARDCSIQVRWFGGVQAVCKQEPMQPRCESQAEHGT